MCGMVSVKTRQRNARGAGGRLRVEIIEATIRLIDQGIDRLSLSATAAGARAVATQHPLFTLLS